jgi:pyruvate kinase
MLSGETATGSYPLEAVKTMADIIRTMETSLFDNLTPFEIPANAHVAGLIGATARVVSDALQHSPIVVVTSTGHTARDIASFRPEARIFSVTHDETVHRQLRLVWGQEPFLGKRHANPDSAVRAAVDLLRRGKQLKAGEHAVLVSGAAPGKPGSTNRLEVIRV